MTIQIKGVSYNIIDGSVYQDHLNEQLDTATVRFLNTGKIADLKPLELVLYNNRWMVIDSITTRQINFYATPQYEYNLNLISEVKLLEGIVLPNIAITQPIVGTKDTLWERLGLIWEVYCPKVRYLSSGQYYLGNRYVLNSSLQAKMNVECPEFSWNTPTLREVLTDLFMVVDALPIINANRELSFFDLTITGTDISSSYLSYVETSITAEEAANQLRSNIVNAVSQPNLVDSFTELVGWRNDENILINDGTRTIQLAHPIYEIESIKMCGVANAEGKLYDGSDILQSANYAFDYYFEWDITALVLNRKAWNIQDNLIPAGTVISSLDDLVGYKESTFFYDQFGNVIYFNEAFQEDSLFTTGTVYTLENIWSYLGQFNQIDAQVVNDTLTGLPSGWYIEEPVYATAWVVNVDDALRKMTFKIKYKGLDEMSVDVGRKINEKQQQNSRTVFDNQSSAFVDSYAQGKFTAQKANRIGNEIVVIRGLYPANATLPSLGDKYDGNIIFSRQITYNANTIAVNLYATKNYVLQNYYTGIRTRNRAYQFLSAGEATLRRDVEKHILEFSFSMKIDDVNDTHPNPASIFVSPLTGYSANSDWKYVLSRFDSLGSPSANPSQNSNTFTGFYSEITRAVYGNSIVLTWQMKDNIEVGRYIDNLNPKGGGGYSQKAYQYVDSEGKARNMYFKFYKVMSPSSITLPTQPRAYLSASDYDTSFYEYSRFLPKVEVSNSTAYEYFGKKLLNKDNREAIGTSLQFEFCSDTPSIIFTDRFILNQKIINPNAVSAVTSYYSVYSSNSETYKQSDTVAKGSINTSMTISITVLSDESVRITLVGGTTPTGSWGIVDGSGRLLIGVNVAGQATPRIIYLNKKYLLNDFKYSTASSALPSGLITV